MEVAIYIRVSTKLQEDKYSLEAQRLELTRYANEQKWNIVDIYKDVDSGGKLHKPGLEALMDAVDDGLIDIVLCVDQDRLSRLDTIEWEILKKTLRENNVKIAQPGNIVDLDNEDDEFISDIKNLIAKREKRMIVRRMKRGLKQMTREGRIHGHIPSEYKLIDGVPVIDDANSWVISVIDKCYLEKNMAPQTIANYLNSFSRNPHGKKWTANYVRNRLENRAYHGVLYRDFKNEIVEVENVFLPLRTKETYELIQRKLKKRSRKRRPATPNYLRDIPITCASCGRKLLIEVGGSGAKKQYIKHSHRHEEPYECEQVMINTERFRENLEKFIIETIFDEEKAREYFNLELNENEEKDIERSIIENKKALAAVNAKMDNLIDLYLDGHFDKTSLDGRKQRLEMEISFLQKEIESAEKKKELANDKKVDLEALYEYFQNVPYISQWNESQKQEFFGDFFENGVCNLLDETLKLSMVIDDAEFEVLFKADHIVSTGLLERSKQRYDEVQRFIYEHPGMNFTRVLRSVPYNEKTIYSDIERFGMFEGLPLLKGSREYREWNENRVRILIEENPRITAKEVSERLDMYLVGAQKLTKKIKEEKTVRGN